MFLAQLPESVALALKVEIVEITRDPLGRGSLDQDEDDPELAGLRMALGVAGYAIFYLPFRGGDGTYVTSIRDWDYSDVRGL
jgi:hypothetical protein